MVMKNLTVELTVAMKTEQEIPADKLLAEGDGPDNRSTRFAGFGFPSSIFEIRDQLVDEQVNVIETAGLSGQELKDAMTGNLETIKGHLKTVFAGIAGTRGPDATLVWRISNQPLATENGPLVWRSGLERLAYEFRTRVITGPNQIDEMTPTQPYWEVRTQALDAIVPGCKAELKYWLLVGV